MSEILTIVWFSATACGAIAGLASLVAKGRRSDLLLIAGVCFAISGTLGLASIGILFLGASVACFVWRSRLVEHPSA